MENYKFLLKELMGALTSGTPSEEILHSPLAERVKEALQEGDGDPKKGFVIRYDDGLYNLEDGFPVRKFEASIYPTRKEAESHAEDFCGVDCIEEL